MDTFNAPAAGQIFCFANQKGGVGKTTTAVNLASYLAASGHRTLLIDADSQANATSSLGVDKHREAASIYEVLMGEVEAGEAIVPIERLAYQGCLDLLPSSVELAGAEVELAARPQGEREYCLKKALEPVRHRYKYILLDCPPSLGLLTLNALSAADAVIIALQCEYLALEGLMQLTNTVSLVLEGLNKQLYILGIVLTMYDSRTNLAMQVAEELRTHFPDLVFKTVIPRSVRLSEAPSYGLSILEYDPNSRGAVAYKGLAEELVARAVEAQQPGETVERRDYA